MSIVDDAEKVMEVVVEDKQLSLAIGKKGQNVRLAAKLTGWKIDIKSEEEKRKEVEIQLGALEIGDAGSRRRREAGGRSAAAEAGCRSRRRPTSRGGRRRRSARGQPKPADESRQTRRTGDRGGGRRRSDVNGDLERQNFRTMN